MTKAQSAREPALPVRRTAERGLHQLASIFEGKQIQGLEQNPETKSRCAQLAWAGKKVTQFISEGPSAVWPQHARSAPVGLTGMLPCCQKHEALKPARTFAFRDC